MQIDAIPQDVIARVREGCAIPAIPLALDAERRFDERRQRAIIRYYIDAGVGGVAVGVHSTQFEIRDPDVALFEPVMTFASEAIDRWCEKRGRAILKVGGVCGPTDQALREASLLEENGYHAVLLSLAALREAGPEELARHCARVAEVMPVIGFYLQPKLAGRSLPYPFWRAFAEIDNVLAIKIAPFDRYRTIDVIRAVCEAGREEAITLYTGNDDSIITDLLTEFRIVTASGEEKRVRIKGGLLGHWSVWTRRAVEQLEEIHRALAAGAGIPPSLLTLAAEVTDSNAAVFDPIHDFAGCIPGIHEVLRRQGLFAGTWCLDPKETLSPGQAEEIDRVYRDYPHLTDDDFIQPRLDEWLS